MNESKQRQRKATISATTDKIQSRSKQAVARIFETQDLFDGQIRIYRTVKSGDVWQFRMYVQAEKRYVRESLRTKDKEIATQKAKARFIEISAKILREEKIFSITAKQLVEKYLAYETERHESGQIRLGRLANVRTHVKHYLRFVGERTAIQNFSGKEFRNYRAFRQKQKKDITMSAVLNELITIQKMYSFAKDEQYIGANYKIDRGVINVSDNDAKRDGYTIKEYERLVSFSKNFFKTGRDDEERYYKELIHLFILGMSHFGFRTGELLSLKWADVQFLKEGRVQITIRAENTKVNKRRVIAGLNGQVFGRIQKINRFKDDSSFVFSKYSKDEMMTKTMLYAYFNELVQRVKTKYDDFDDTKTLYSLRHFYITIRLLADSISVYQLARYCGTSLQMIQKTYDNVTDLDVSKKMMASKQFVFRNGELVMKDDLVSSESEMSKK
jgi:integrase